MLLTLSPQKDCHDRLQGFRAAFVARAAVSLALHLATVLQCEAQGFWLARHLVSIVSSVDHCRGGDRLRLVLSA
jgi:hypothetical protein